MLQPLRPDAGTQMLVATPYKSGSDKKPWTRLGTGRLVVQGATALLHSTASDLLLL